MKKYVLFIAFLLLLSGIGLLLWAPRTTAPSKTSTKTQSQPKQSTATKPTTEAFNKDLYSHTDPSSPWVVVNKQHPLNPIDYAPADLTPVGGGQVMRKEAADALKKMLNDAKTAGFIVTPASGYRSYQTQVSVYNAEVKDYGQAAADGESARPGFSEHQTGWAMDLASGGCSITDCFGDTPGGKWVTENAYKYGYLLRYQASNSDVTGYRAETWHFRYIGPLLAAEMRAQNVTTLETFFGVSGGADYAQ